METTAKAFWSYAHADNKREQDRILRLANLVREEYESLTGTTIEIFTDRSKIKWGDDFRAKLDEALQETTFFVPILTPTYFVREECRKEMSQFVRSAKALGLQQLLLSLRYISVADMTEESADELKAVAAKMQFEPWDELRLEDEQSSTHRKAVNGLAARLVELTMSLESASPAAKAAGNLGTPSKLPEDSASTDTDSRTPSESGAETPALRSSFHGDEDPREVGGLEAGDLEDDEPGLIDLVADAQPAMESWTQTLNELTDTSSRFNKKFEAATERMNRGTSPQNAFAHRILVSRELASEVEPELQELETLSKTYSSGLLRLDATIRAMFSLTELAPDGSGAEDVATFRTSVTNLVNQARTAMAGLESAADAARKNAKLSRDLRPVLRRYETAMRNILDGFSIIQEWEAI